MYVYCVYPAMSKTLNWLKRADTSIVLSFLMVYTVKSVLIPWSVTVYNKNLSSQCNLTAQIKTVQDKCSY